MILANSHEYRAPTKEGLLANDKLIRGGSITADMRSRYVGLIVVPGKITRRIEVEDTSSDHS